MRRLPEDPDAILRRLAKDIDGLTAADIALLECMADWIAIRKRATRQLLIEGLLITDTTHGNGEESRKHPLVIVIRTATEQINAIAQQLGATPMARARLPEREAEQMTLGEEFMEIARRRRSQASKDE